MTQTVRAASAAPLLVLLLALLPPAAAAQLRPLDPFDWSMFEAGRTVSVQLGGGAFRGQRASLAGTEGRLQEWGNFTARWRTGRVVLEAGGTVRRTFQDERAFAEALWLTQTPDDGRRADSGDYRVATVVRLTPERWVPVALRFGARLPTTDDVQGLDRDLTDFFALLGAELRRGGGTLAGEAGVGLHGSRYDHFEQVDVLLYTLSAAHGWGPARPFATLTGQWDGPRQWRVRGNESLQEVRLGARLGGRRWVEVAAVRGTAEFSPRDGLLVSAGASW